MKLRIPRRIKVEEDSSESENDPANVDSGRVEEELKDKDILPVVTSKTITVSEISYKYGEIDCHYVVSTG